MIDVLQQWALAQLAHNDVFAGIVGGGVVGGAAYYLRALPRYLWRAARHWGTVEVVVHDDHPMFGMIERWLAKHDYAARCRRLTMRAGGPRRDDEDDAPVAVAVAKKRGSQMETTPGEGVHWLREAGQWVRLQRSEETTQSGVQRRWFQITSIGRGPDAIMGVMRAAREIGSSTRGMTRTLSWRHGYWSERIVRSRPLDTLVYVDDSAGLLLADMRRFLASEADYARRGIPWRRGYLLRGDPGTGKSSLAFALAGELDLPLYSLNLSGVQNDTALMEAFASAAGGVLVLEDIDRMDVNVKAEKGENGLITLAGLLAALDSPMAAEGTIVVMTANWGLIDGAVMRPGRTDRIVTLARMGALSALRLVRVLYQPDEAAEREAAPYCAALARSGMSDCSEPPWRGGRRDEATRTAAEVQAVYLEHPGSYADGVARLCELFGVASDTLATLEELESQPEMRAEAICGARC